MRASTIHLTHSAEDNNDNVACALENGTLLSVLKGALLSVQRARETEREHGATRGNKTRVKGAVSKREM